MAVQAQYPSSVFLLNRSVQDGKNPLPNDYSLQQPRRLQGGGEFLHQMIFTNGVGTSNNSRKRRRDLTAATSSSIIHPFSLQTPHHLDHHLQPNVVSTGLRLASAEEQQQKETISSLLLSQDLAPQISQQTDEIQHYLQAQGEQLRRTLAEKRQTQYRALLRAAEESLARSLREKEAEVEKAARRNAELEARAAQLGAQLQLWQARAREQGATAASLQAQLQQAIIFGVQAQEKGGGELGCGAGGEAEDAESAYIDPERVEEASGPSCRACRKRVSSVVLLPCRHFCLCTECGALAQACPLCLAFKESTVEVFLS